jgi:hypothetical protein
LAASPSASREDPGKRNLGKEEKNKHTNMSLLFKFYPNLSNSEMVK